MSHYYPFRCSYGCKTFLGYQLYSPEELVGENIHKGDEAMIDEEIDSMDQDEEGIVPTEDEADTIGC
jgi:hypothetical protein